MEKKQTEEKKQVERKDQNCGDKEIAFVIAGGAALIAEELALAKSLIEGLNPSGKKIRPNFITGTSAGALAAALINGIIQNKEASGKMTWEILEREILFPLRNEDIYSPSFVVDESEYTRVHRLLDISDKMCSGKEGAYEGACRAIPKKNERGVAGCLEEFWEGYKQIYQGFWDICSAKMDIMGSIPDIPGEVMELKGVLRNIRNGYILDTAPLQATLKKFINGKDYLNYHKLSDTYLPTFINSTSNKNGVTWNFFSENAQDGELDLVEILMGSSAIAGIFPSRDIADLGSFVDGGLREAVPTTNLIKKGKYDNYKKTFDKDKKYDEVYVICPKINLLLGTMRHQYNFFPFLSNFLYGFEIFMWSASSYQISAALNLVKDKDKAFIYMPEYKTDYNYLNFDTMKPQYKETLHWAANHPPEKITEFLKRHKCTIGQTNTAG